MRRKWLARLSLVALVLALAVGVALAAAVKFDLKSVDPTLPDANGKAMLNFSDEDPLNPIIIANVNCSNLAPETTYTVEVRDSLAAVMGSDTFTTKPDKAKKDNGKGNDDKPPKKHGKSKGHVNIHIPWNPLTPPPDLSTWSVVVLNGLTPVLAP